jgi:O-Antigen ligase
MQVIDVGEQRRGLLLGGGVVVAAGLTGAAVAVLPAWLSVAALAIAMLALWLVLMRNILRPASTAQLAVDEPVATSSGLRFARLLYYVGAALIGFLTIRPAAGFTASDWIFFLSLGIAAFALITSGDSIPYRIPRPVTFGVMLFAVGGIGSSVHALHPLGSAAIVIRLLYLTLVWFWLGTVLLQKPQHVYNALVAWVCSAAASSAGAIVQYFKGDVIPNGYVFYGRMTGFTEHVSDLGGLAAIAFVPALMLAVDAKDRRLRYVGAVSVGLVGAGILLSGSVGGLIAALVATCFWLAIRGLSVRIIVGLVAVVATAAVLMSATGVTNTPSPFKRISRVTSSQDFREGTGGSVQSRFEGYRLAWHRIESQPFVGVGLDDADSQRVLGDTAFVHNILLNPWLTAGILGLVGMVLLLWGSFSCGHQVLRLSSEEDRPLVSALLAGFIAFVVFGLGEPVLFVRYGWFPIALLVALRAQQLRATNPVTARVRTVTPRYRLQEVG